MEYLEDLSLDGSEVGGTPLLPMRQPQLKAHCRLWVDHVNRKVLPAFYALLLTPPPRRRSNGSNGVGERTIDVDVNSNSADHDAGGGGRNDEAMHNTHCILVDTLQTAITKLVNASHAT
ncbi:MAG: hypothetical protein M1823_008044, partial [Watsoniomyces obsoletus]